MKKLFCLCLALTLLISAVGCGRPGDTAMPQSSSSATEESQAPPPESQQAEIALVTDLGSRGNTTFNQGAYQGIQRYVVEHKSTYRHYRSAEKTTDSYLEAIALAVKNGAKVIVAPGCLLEPAIYIAQDQYPNVLFILLDGYPNNGAKDDTYEEKINSNVYSIFYAEEQAGFLAGYAAVKDGYTKLGFMGGIALPLVQRYGYGYVQGAEYAAKEMNLENGSIFITYTYANSFEASPENQTLAASWYNAGTEVIFACGGALGNAVMAAAKPLDKKVIGVDVDQSGQSGTVITSAVKNISGSVYQALCLYKTGKFPHGKSVSLDARVNGVGLAMENACLRNFSSASYNSIYKKLAAGEIPLLKDTDITAATDIKTTKVVVTLVG